MAVHLLYNSWCISFTKQQHKITKILCCLEDKSHNGYFFNFYLTFNALFYLQFHLLFNWRARNKFNYLRVPQDLLTCNMLIHFWVDFVSLVFLSLLLPSVLRNYSCRKAKENVNLKMNLPYILQVNKSCGTLKYYTCNLNYCTCIHRKAILLFNWVRVYQAVRMMRLQGNKSPKKARRRRQENVLTQVIV